MISIKEVKKIVRRTALSQNKNAVSSVISGKYNVIADYSSHPKQPKICSLNLESCKTFYRAFSQSNDSEAICPYGFKVNKYSRALPAKAENIIIYSIVGNTGKDIHKIDKTHKSQRRQYDEAINDVKGYGIDETEANQEHNNLIEIFETLMIGRIGMSVQGLTHQILTPIQAAIADIENVRSHINPQGLEYIYRLQHSVGQITSISHQLQVIISTDMEYNRNMLRNVVVHNIINNSIENASLAAKNKYVEVQQGFNHYGKSVQCVPYHMSILFDNLIENAVKYSFSGFPDYLRRVAVKYREKDQNLLVEVENIGCQITPEEIKDGLIFELGYRGVSAQDRERDGTGTGLYVCKKIVDLYNGSITIESTPIDDEGEENRRFKTRFIVEFPYYQT